MRNLYTLLALLGLMSWGTSRLQAQTYCQSGASSTFDTNIEFVKLVGENDSLENNTALVGAGYSDFTNSTTLGLPDLIKDSTYTIIVRTSDDNAPTSSFPNYFGRASSYYIDFNNDGDFTDAGELLGSGTTTFGGSTPPPTDTITFTVPSTAFTTVTRLRVVCEEGGSTPVGSCNTFTWGETEDYDVAVFAPTTGVDAGIRRLIFDNQCNYLANTSLTINMGNNGTLAFPAGMTLNYQVDNNTPVSQPYSGTIPQFADTTVTFTLPFSVTTLDTFTLRAWVVAPNDADSSNDTLEVVVTQSPLISTFPQNYDFEASGQPFTVKGNPSSWQWGAPIGDTISFAAGGFKAWVTDTLNDYLDNEAGYLESVCFSFADDTLPRISFDLWRDLPTFSDGMQLWYSIDNGQSWEVVGDASGSDPFLTNWYNNAAIFGLQNFAQNGGNTAGWLGSSSGWETVTALIPEAAGEGAVRFALAFGTNGFTSTDDGIGIDNFRVEGIPRADDLAITSLVSPVSATGLTASETVTVALEYLGTDTITAGSTIPISFSVNGGTVVTENLLTGFEYEFGSVDTFTFAATANMSTPGAYLFEVYHSLASDADNLNDTLLAGAANIPTIDTFPYLDDFEALASIWSTGGPQNPWELGTPNSPPLVSANSGTQAWTTRLNSDYIGDENGVLVSPLFDISSMTLPKISLAIDREIEASWDGVRLEYSLDSGATWATLGSVGTALGTNWYNDASIFAFTDQGLQGNEEGWSGTAGWQNAEYIAAELRGEDDVQFRFQFSSDGIVNFAGVSIDDFGVDSVPPLDLALQQLLLPSNPCGNTATDTIRMVVRFEGYDTLAAGQTYDFAVAINGGTPVSQSFTVPDSMTFGDVDTLEFTNTFNFATIGTYNIVGFLTTPTFDPKTSNDTLTGRVETFGIVSNFPYEEDFEGTGLTGWSPAGINSSWQLGSASSPNMTGAGKGQNAWVTNLTGNANGNEDSRVQGPCLDMTAGDTLPWVALSINYNSGFNDGANIQVSADSGRSWVTIGNVGDPWNWYNHTFSTFGTAFPGGGTVGWEGSGTFSGSNGWIRAAHPMPAGVDSFPELRVRINYADDDAFPLDGFGFDALYIGSPQDSVQFAQDTVTICSGESVSGTFGHSNPEHPYAQFIWQNSSGTQIGSDSTFTFTNLNAIADTFELTLTRTDTNGLPTFDEVVVVVEPGPAVRYAGSQLTLCPGDSINIEADTSNAGRTVFTYSWNTNNTTWVQADVDTSGFFTYTASNAAGTCSVTDSVEIVLIDSAEINLPADTLICGTPPQQLVGPQFANTALRTYNWLNAANGSPLSPDDTLVLNGQTRRSVVYRVADACFVSQDTLLLTYYPQRPMPMLGPDTTICEGTSLTLDATYPVDGPTYAWSTANTLPTQVVGDSLFGATASLTIDVMVTDSNGCFGMDTITVNQDPLPVAGFTDTPGAITQILSFNSTSTNADSLVWDLGDGTVNSSNIGNLLHTYTAEGPVTVTLIAFNACGTDTATADFTIVGVSEGLTAAGVELYPNPNSGAFTVQLGQLANQPLDIALVNAVGQVALQYTESDAVNGSVRVQAEHLPKGLYLVRIRHAGGVGYARVVFE